MVDRHPHAGHRARLRQRFLRGGINALNDYEILELLLGFVLPRRDTKPTAKELMRRFGTVSDVLGAGEQGLRKVEGIGERTAAFLLLLREVSTYCLRERLQHRSAITHRRNVEDYLRFAFGSRRDEYVAVIFLDSASNAIGAEVIAEGTVNQCVIYPRAIVEKALSHGAAALILAHNHPAGTLRPSEADWSITERLSELGNLLDLPLLDHIIVCRDRVRSLREMPRWPRQVDP